MKTLVLLALSLLFVGCSPTMGSKEDHCTLPLICLGDAIRWTKEKMKSQYAAGDKYQQKITSANWDSKKSCWIIGVVNLKESHNKKILPIYKGYFHVYNKHRVRLVKEGFVSYVACGLQ